MDAIPHWHYKLASYVKNLEDPLKDDIGTDGLAGFVLAVYFFKGKDGFLNPSSPVLAGALGGILPDLFQFTYWKIRKEPLLALQKFHLFIHTKKHIVGALPEIIYQVVIIVVAIFLSKIIF